MFFMDRASVRHFFRATLRFRACETAAPPRLVPGTIPSLPVRSPPFPRNLFLVHRIFFLFVHLFAGFLPI